MGDFLSQDEIDALLGGSSTSSDTDKLSNMQKDTLGEIGNISMGTAATTLSSLLNNKVVITTPKVNFLSFEKLKEKYKDQEYVYIDIEYKAGLQGDNVLFLKEKDVKIISNLMMNQEPNLDEPLTDLHLSAISEAMNQMIGSACTSMSSMFKSTIDINPPKAVRVSLTDESTKDILGFDTEDLVEIAFKMEVGDLIDSEIMQIIPYEFAKKMVDIMMQEGEKEEVVNTKPQVEYMEPKEIYVQPEMPKAVPVNAKPVNFEKFNDAPQSTSKSSIDIIKDVNLEVTVELGKANKKVKEVLGFNVGTIIELDKVSGEPIDILVNGKPIAKGEVVVVDENFAIRITEIEAVENRF